MDIQHKREGQEWDHNTATLLIEREVTSYKASSGIKLRDNTNGNFNCPLIWWKNHQYDYPYLQKMAIKLLAIPATSAPSEHVFSTAGLEPGWMQTGQMSLFSYMKAYQRLKSISK